MLSKHFFNALSRLISSRWVHDYKEHNGHCEDAFYARFGPLYLEVNHCFVLDHDDAQLSIQLPTAWGRLRVGYVVCLGEEQIRQPGFYTNWQSTFRNRNGVGTAVSQTEDIPF
ncbi:MAG: hypothetical protein KC421_10885 [Anaerolineales bacterium]|nr:hypothetical protein [Anaerolineales bacterium]